MRKYELLFEQIIKELNYRPRMRGLLNRIDARAEVKFFIKHHKELNQKYWKIILEEIPDNRLQLLEIQANRKIECREFYRYISLERNRRRINERRKIKQDILTGRLYPYLSIR